MKIVIYTAIIGSVDQLMKRFILLFISLLYALYAYPQKTDIHESGVMGEQNLKAIENISPYFTGVVFGFDPRYEGIKGTTRLFDTLFASALLISGQENYIQLNSDIDLVRNSLILIHPSTAELMEISSDSIIEIIVNRNDKQLIYRTTKGLIFDKEIQENQFYQVLNESPNQFIKIPEKKIIEANYQGNYSPNRRFDEFKLVNMYYIADSDYIFHRVQLNKKSLSKLFPDKRELIDKGFKENSGDNAEEKVISILKKF
jgi:hypothetical protein